MIWTTAFWKGLSERGIKTFAQTLAAYFVIGTTGLLDLDWVTALSVSGAAALASALTSIGNADFVAGVSEDSGADLDVEVVDEITTVTKYRPKNSAALDDPHNTTP